MTPEALRRLVLDYGDRPTVRRHVPLAQKWDAFLADERALAAAEVNAYVARELDSPGAAVRPS